MKKNVASQQVQAMLVNLTTGAPVTTGTTNVYVSVDGAPQTLAGGSPSAFHLGQGVWSYVTTAADTNGDHCSFTFVNSSAVNVLVQIYTSFPQTGDNFARIGAPVGASISADVAAVKADTLAGRTVTDKLGDLVVADSSPANFRFSTNALSGVWDSQRAGHALTGSFGEGVASVQGNVTGSVGSVTGAVGSVTGNVGGNVTGSVGSVVGAVGSVTGNVGGNVVGTVASVSGAVGSVTGNVGGNVVGTVASVVGAVGSVTGLTASDVGAIKAKTDNLPSDPADASDIASAFSTVNSTLSTISSYVDTEVASIKTVTDKLGTMVAADGSPGDYVFTAPALARGPSGSGGSGPTLSQIVNGVWDEPIASHLTVGTTGKSLNSATSAGDPWASVLEGSMTAGTLLRVSAGVAAGKDTIVDQGGGVADVTFRDVSDTTNLVVGHVVNSRRTSVTITP